MSDTTNETKTLRDELAMAAMQGFCADPGFTSPFKTIAESAYRMADAMLAERAK